MATSSQTARTTPRTPGLTSLNLANKLTLVRILAVPLCVLLLMYPGRWTCLVATAVFGLASLTDLADGIIARRYGMVTPLGTFLDPLADKLLTGSMFIMLTTLPEGAVPAWVAVVILGREMTVTGLRTVAVEQGVVLAADRYGKLKTVLQIIAILLLTLHETWFGIDPKPAGIIVLYAALVMTVFSGANYLYNFHKNWLDGQT